MKCEVKKFGKVAVLLGGLTAEREVSLMSGQCVFDALIHAGVNAHRLDVGHDVIQQLIAGKFDRAFNILHGRYGEDGVIQGVLETLNIPYTGSGVAASALGMDKIRTKQVWQSLALPTLPYQVINEDTAHEELVKKFGLPLCVKPVHEGSSNGVSCVRTILELPKAYSDARQFNDEVMVEPWIIGREFTVGILGEEAMPVIEIIVPSGFYDYQAKYFSNDTRYQCPCDLPSVDQDYLKKLAINAFHAIGCSGWGRVDFLRDSQGKFWLTELNTVPGMTTHSLVPKAANKMGISFDELVLLILSKTIKDGDDGSSS